MNNLIMFFFILIIILLIVGYINGNKKLKKEAFSFFNNLNFFKTDVESKIKGILKKNNSEGYDNSSLNTEDLNTEYKNDNLNIPLKEQTNIVSNNPKDNSGMNYTPSPSSNDDFFEYTKDNEVVDKMDPNNLLPKETRPDWFGNSQEDIKVNMNNLIDQHRPIGISTVQSSRRNGSRDIRTQIPNPKFIVSPWHMTSIEPDVIIKETKLF